MTQDVQGCSVWKVVETPAVLPAADTALLLCDVWDNHWSRGAALRVNAMAGRMNRVVCTARERGAQIVHAPSDTMAFYEGNPARQRMKAIPRIEPPPLLEHTDPPLPIDDSDGGSDTGEASWYTAWSRQHPAIEIDESRDVISDNGEEVYSFLQHKGIGSLIILGVHANMCVLGRSFAIKRMVRWGMSVMLVRDLTDTMYNPAKAPYVSHGEGTRLVVEFIEKFWCPTIGSYELGAGDHG
ncbi:MAG: isochorismatase [Armatimonadetes bacterium]|nr:isochorismatase [Armatimonadota bacterium]